MWRKYEFFPIPMLPPRVYYNTKLNKLQMIFVKKLIFYRFSSKIIPKAYFQSHRCLLLLQWSDFIFKKSEPTQIASEPTHVGLIGFLASDALPTNRYRSKNTDQFFRLGMRLVLFLANNERRSAKKHHQRKASKDHRAASALRFFGRGLICYSLGDGR